MNDSRMFQNAGIINYFISTLKNFCLLAILLAKKNKFETEANFL